MKKALFLTIDFPPMGGGMARHAADVCGALKRSGVETSVIAPSAGNMPVDDIAGIPVTRLKSVVTGRIFDNYLGSVLAFLIPGMRYAAAQKPDLVLANTWSIAGVAAMLIKRFTGVPYAVFVHGLDIYAGRSSAKVSALMRMVIGNASAVIANSNFTKDLVARVTGFAGAVVLNPMVEPSRLLSAAGRGERRPGSPGTILTVARLVESKGHDLVIRAMPKILAKFPDTVYRIVGSGPLGEELKRLASREGVSDHVIFEGEVGDGALAGFYRDCDIFVMTSREINSRGEVEGFGITFLEAGVFSKPVVGSRCGGIPDAIADGVSGVVADPADPDTIAGIIINLFTDTALARRMGEAGRLRAEKGFGPEAFAVKLKAIIDKAAAR